MPRRSTSSRPAAKLAAATPAYLSLREAADLCPPSGDIRGGGRRHAHSLWRWCTAGVQTRDGRRVRLGHVTVDGRYLVTAEQVAAFLDAVKAGDQNRPSVCERPR
jgi:hypothetical protein